jgi:hypothetical protein
MAYLRDVSELLGRFGLNGSCIGSEGVVSRLWQPVPEGEDPGAVVEQLLGQQPA